MLACLIRDGPASGREARAAYRRRKTSKIVHDFEGRESASDFNPLKGLDSEFGFRRAEFGFRCAGLGFRCAGFGFRSARAGARSRAEPLIAPESPAAGGRRCW